MAPVVAQVIVRILVTVVPLLLMDFLIASTDPVWAPVVVLMAREIVAILMTVVISVDPVLLTDLKPPVFMAVLIASVPPVVPPVVVVVLIIPEARCPQKMEGERKVGTTKDHRNRHFCREESG